MKWYFIVVLICSSLIWPPHAKSWLIGKDSDAGSDWGQEEKGATEDEMAGWHRWLDGREPEWTPGVGDGQGGLVCCDSWVSKSRTWLSDWTEPNDIWWTSFHMLIYHLYTFFDEMSVYVLCPFLNSVSRFSYCWIFKHSSYTLDSSSLSDMYFANIFSWIVACLLILLTISFAEQTFLILMKPNLSIFSFTDHT